MGKIVPDTERVYIVFNSCAATRDLTLSKQIKGWRKADNKFKIGATSTSAANFANVNNNGNANYNNASNSNGVRPDFNSAVK